MSISAKDAAVKLKIPLVQEANDKIIIDGDDIVTKIELREIGSSYGYAGAPIHENDRAFSPVLSVYFGLSSGSESLFCVDVCGLDGLVEKLKEMREELDRVTTVAEEDLKMEDM